MRPSYGFGGSWLPKEVRTLFTAGLDRGLPMHLAGAVSDANADHQRRFARRIAEAVGGLAGKRIALLGLAFKADTDDVRSSPALRLAARLLAEGADLRAHDPAASENARRLLPDLVVLSSAEEALQGADAAVIATEWPVYRDLDWATLRATMRRPLVIDGRRLLPEAELRALGYAVERIGDGVGGGWASARRTHSSRSGLSAADKLRDWVRLTRMSRTPKPPTLDGYDRREGSAAPPLRFGRPGRSQDPIVTGPRPATARSASNTARFGAGSWPTRSACTMPAC
jgi:hypothetical protein